MIDWLVIEWLIGWLIDWLIVYFEYAYELTIFFKTLSGDKQYQDDDDSCPVHHAMPEKLCRFVLVRKASHG